MEKPVGHERAVQLLERTGNLGNHAYLLVGPEHIGKATLVKWLAAKLQCQNPEAPCGTCADCRQVQEGVHQDVWWVERREESQDITIAQVRELQQFVSLASLSGSTRVVVVDGAEHLNQESGNALLKVLEEPPERTLFFLVTHEPRAVLPTIRSRCFVLYLSPTTETVLSEWLKEEGVAKGRVRELSRFAAGRPGLAKRLLQDEDELKARYEAAQVFAELVNGGAWQTAQAYLTGTVKGDEPSAERERAWWLTGVWLESSRDLLLCVLNQQSFIRFEAMQERLNRLAGRVSLETAYRLTELVRQAREKLARNGHVRLTMEWLAYSIVHTSS